MSTLATRFAALRQQESEKRSTAVLSPRRLRGVSPASTQHRSSNGEDDDDSVFPPLGALIPNTSAANAVVGQRRRRNSEDDNEASTILQARQAQLDRDRVFAKERMKYHSVADIQAEIDITAFSATSTDQKLIEVRIIQEVEIRTLKAAIIAMSSQAKNTNSKLYTSIVCVIASPRIPLYVTGVLPALLHVAKKTPHLLGLPIGFDSSATTWHDTAKSISDHLISGRSVLRQKLQHDRDRCPSKASKGKPKKRSGRMPLARLAAELFGKQGPVSTDALGRAALLRSLYRDYLDAVKSSQNPKTVVEDSPESDGTPADPEETDLGPEIHFDLGEDEDSFSTGDASQSVKSKASAPKWGPNAFWNYVDYSFVQLRKTIAETTGSQQERKQLYDSFVTDVIQRDLKEFPASGTVEEDLELRTAGFREVDDRPEFQVQLESAVFECLKLT